jgi:hypothetical protein
MSVSIRKIHPIPPPQFLKKMDRALPGNFLFSESRLSGESLA